MIAFLTLLYCGLVWLIFIYQPCSKDVRVYELVVEIVPRVTGRVIEVPVEGGTRVGSAALRGLALPSPVLDDGAGGSA